MLLKLVTWPAAATLLSQPAISVLALQKGYSTYTPALPPLAPIGLKAKRILQEQTPLPPMHCSKNFLQGSSD